MDMINYCKNMNGIINDIIQGSNEWLKFRRGKITGTRAHAVLVNGKGVDTLIDELVIEIISEQHEQSFKSFAMQRGNDLEPLAREAFEVAELDFREVFQVGCVTHEKIKDFMISPDGLFSEYGLLEIKCFEAKNYFKHLKEYKKNRDNFRFLDESYNTQVQAGLSCTGNNFAIGVIYNPDFTDNDYIEFRIERDDDKISLLEEIAEEVISKRNKILKEFMEF